MEGFYCFITRVERQSCCSLLGSSESVELGCFVYTYAVGRMCAEFPVAQNLTYRPEHNCGVSWGVSVHVQSFALCCNSQLYELEETGGALTTYSGLRFETCSAQQIVHCGTG